MKAGRALARYTRGLALVCLLTATASSSTADEPRPRGWLGVAMGVATGGGVKVERVIHGSPAEKAGLRLDDQITQVDGAAVTTSRDVVRTVGHHAVGDDLNVTILRAGKAQVVRVVLADFPSLDAMLRMDHVGSPAPAWDGLEPLSGFPASIAGLRGHVVLVDFWATWCGPCREMAPVLSGWQARYGAEGLSIVGITTDPSEAAARFKEQLGLRYPMASDPHGSTASAYGISALPTLYIIDKRGIVREVSVGVGPDQDARLEALIRALLAEPVTNP